MTGENRLLYRDINTPIGRLRLVGNGETLHHLYFLSGKQIKNHPNDWIEEKLSFEAVLEQLNSYFAKQCKSFDIDVCLTGTHFQKLVWKQLRNIPFGETQTYAKLAELIGRPKAVRAVGAAIGANPIPIIIPCHRVIGSDQSLTGFSGGLEKKVFLLRHEGAEINNGFVLDKRNWAA